ncbi:GNAT family N-acetyltransferase [Tenggerimyces flavus]|uniref:GNAT family N-acetyltransferase n=1 Tax=Tenggerimyces flavus TaxID=1708749 RepID=A0ABV7YPM6_9ACTN|nr:GNAT family N-acetyltransferase [Tenggerimyces flavus]MBM7789384.1 GNAT superfamily N-acetyltransferase [Tenggerimyces flavus]
MPADVTIRPVDGEADFRAWREVRVAVTPNERVAPLEEIIRGVKPDDRHLLAIVGDAVVGSGHAGRASRKGHSWVMPRVVPSFQRRGIGTALLHELVAHVQALGFDEVDTMADDPGSVAFGTRFGFYEYDRQVEQIRSIGTEPWPTAPAGVEIVTLAERPDLTRELYDNVGTQAFEDMAIDSPLVVSYEDWEGDWITDPEATFAALADGEAIGMAGFNLDPDEPTRAEHALTVVRRDWRGRGVAAALKRCTLAWAAENGLVEVYTWTQRGNADMRALNERLGFTYRTESISLRSPIPLKLPA